MDKTALEALITLCALPDVGPVTVRRVLRSYGSATAALCAGPAELGPAAARALGSRQVSDRVARALDTIARLGVRVLRETDASYPDRLHHLAMPPDPLFARGELGLVDEPVVAVVGARRHTRYGAEAARLLAGDLANAGVVIVSGLARGIDTVAHEAATPGRTIAVLGSGIDIAYPRQNARLQEQIARHGLLLSEFLPGEPVLRHRFPQRNRIIGALASAVVVVEASAKSGSLSTARHALDLGREVFAVPGPIGRETSVGTNQLIRDGAGLATEAADILREIGVPARERRDEPRPRRRPPQDVSAEARAVWRALSDDEEHIDVLSAQAKLPSAATLAALLELEIAGHARQLPGMFFCAA